MAKVGWDKPLKVRYNYKLPELMSAVRQHTPVGDHSHDRLNRLRYSKSGFPRTGGRLRREAGKLSNYRAPKGKDMVQITIDLPYARIVDIGGPVGPVSGKTMVASNGGIDAKFTQRVGFTIRGAHYIRKGFEDWADLPASRGIVPEWTD